jgi:predicted short-subunit dehydrogenase-like oxidoreductase (DUF2520 family)
MHQSVAKILHTITNANPPQKIGNIAELVDITIATSLHAIRSKVHSTLSISPDVLVFHQDMWHAIPIFSNFEAIQAKRQVLFTKVFEDKTTISLSHQGQNSTH